jgi:hypothetical protein
MEFSKCELPLDMVQRMAFDNLLCSLKLYHAWLDSADHVMGEALSITRQTLNGKTMDADRLLDAMISAHTDYLDCVAKTLDSSALPGLQALGSLSEHLRDAVKTDSSPALQLCGTLFEAAGEFIQFTHHQNQSLRIVLMGMAAFPTPSFSMREGENQGAPGPQTAAPPDSRAAASEETAQAA